MAEMTAGKPGVQPNRQARATTLHLLVLLRMLQIAGTTITLGVEPASTIEGVKDKFHHKEKHPAHLIVAGKQRESSWTISLDLSDWTRGRPPAADSDTDLQRQTTTLTCNGIQQN